MSTRSCLIVLLGITLLISNCAAPEEIAADVNPSTAVSESTAPAAAAAEPAEVSTATAVSTRSWNVIRTPGPGSTPEPDPETPEAVQDGTPAMELVADVTVPDGSVVQPGELLLKIWRVENTGDTTWQTEWPPYQLAFHAGDQLSGPSTAQALFYPPGVDLSLAPDVQAWSDPFMTLEPGEQADLPLLLRAPDSAGHYRGYWMLLTGEGEELGGVYLDIIVEADGAPQGTWSGAWTQQDPYITSDCTGPLNLVQEGSQVSGFGYACGGRLLLVAGAVTEPGVVEGRFGLAGFVFPFTWVMLPGGNQFRGVYQDSAFSVGAWCGGRYGAAPPFDDCMPPE